MIVKRILLLSGLGGFLTLGSGCVMQRTVSDGSAVVSENYVVKRPLRDALTEKEKAP